MEEVWKCMVAEDPTLVQVDDGKTHDKVVRDAEGMLGLRRLTEANRYNLRRTVLILRWEARMHGIR